MIALAALAVLDGSFNKPIAGYFTTVNFVFPVTLLGSLASYLEIFRTLARIDLSKTSLPPIKDVDSVNTSLNILMDVFQKDVGNHTPKNFLEAAKQADLMVNTVKKKLTDPDVLRLLSSIVDKMELLTTIIEKDSQKEVKDAVIFFTDFIETAEQILLFKNVFIVDLTEEKAVAAALEKIKIRVRFHARR